MNRDLLRGATSLALCVFFLLAAAGTAAAADMQVSADGTVDAVTATRLVITTTAGEQKTVSMGPDTLVMSREAARTTDIAVGDAMGVDAKRRPDGSLRAVAITIFSPELWKVVRKGQWPMESGDVMTNAVVTQAAVAAMDERSITLRYQDLTAVISLPEDTVVRRIVTLSPATLASGMHVIVRGTAGADGSIAATSVFEDQPGQG